MIFRYGTARNSNTFDALRLTKLAQSKGYRFGSEFVERMYKAYFEDNLVMADHDVLRKIAADAGMDAKEVDDLLDGDSPYPRERTESLVRETTDAAVAALAGLPGDTAFLASLAQRLVGRKV